MVKNMIKGKLDNKTAVKEFVKKWTEKDFYAEDENTSNFWTDLLNALGVENTAVLSAVIVVVTAGTACFLQAGIDAEFQIFAFNGTGQFILIAAFSGFGSIVFIAVIVSFFVECGRVAFGILKGTVVVLKKSAEIVSL